MAKKKKPTSKANRRLLSKTASAGRAHLVIRLKKGWSWDAARRQFVHIDGETLKPAEDLPRYTRVLQQVPSMAKRASRTKAEDELARGFQIVPPKSVVADLSSSREIKFFDELVEVASAWPCVEKVWVSPHVVPAKPKGGRSKKSTTKTKTQSAAKRTKTRRPKSTSQRRKATAKGGMSLPGGAGRKRT